MKTKYLSVNHPRLVLAILGIATAVSIFFLLQLKMDNSLEVWLARKDPKLDLYREFCRRFGTEEYLLVALCKDDAFSEETMGLVSRLAEEFSKLEELSSVESLSKVYSLWRKPREEGGVPYDLETFRQDILQSPFYVGLLVSPTGRDSAILARMTPKGTANRQHVADVVRDLVSRIVPKERTVYYAGSAIFNAELNEISESSSKTFYPIVAIAGIGLLVLVLKSMRMSLVASAAVGVSILWGVGAMAGVGKPLNVVTFALPAILLVTTVSYALHFLLEYRRQVALGKTKRECVIAAHDLVAIPCLLSAVTTSIGFGSLVVSRVGPVMDLGLFAALSVLGAYVAVVYGIGAAAMSLPSPKRWKELKGKSLGEAAAARHFGFQRSWFGAHWWIIGIGVVYTVVAAVYASRVYFEANPFQFFPKDNPVTLAHDYLEHELSGLSQLEIQLKGKKGEDLLKLSALKDFDKLEQALLKNPNVTKVITPADFVKESLRSHSMGDASAYKLPRRQSQLRQALNGIMTSSLRERLGEHYAEDNRYARISIRLKTLGSRQYQAMIDYIQAILDQELGDKYETLVTGLVPLVVSAQKYMVTSQVESLSLAVVLIAVTFVLLLRSIRLTVLGLLPNLIPILGTFGFMGWRHIPLDPATIMVASVSLGIVVDNTIHFLFRYTRNLKTESPLDAVMNTLKTSGQAITFAGLVNCLGFAVMIFSGFQPMRHFGLLVSITMFCAFLGATILLPSLLLALGPGRKDPLSRIDSV